MDHWVRRGLILLPVLWMASATAVNAGERVYGAEPIESQWRIKTDSVQCRLEHPIPQFGQASFVQALDVPLRFELSTLRPQQPGQVALRAIPPEWRPGFPIVELGEAGLMQGHRALRVDDHRAEWLLAELEEGVYPAIFFAEPVAGRGGVAVVLSGVRFRDALDTFLECRSKLLNVDVTALRNRTLRFDTNKSSIGDSDRQALRELARFASSGDARRKVIVEAHTDARGGTLYNEKLSRRRAEAVRDYLIAQGVQSEQIQISTLGERKPLADNRSAEGRSQNRRASVRVVN